MIESRFNMNTALNEQLVKYTFALHLGFLHMFKSSKAP